MVQFVLIVRVVAALLIALPLAVCRMFVVAGLLHLCSFLHLRMPKSEWLYVGYDTDPERRLILCITGINPGARPVPATATVSAAPLLAAATAA